MNSTGHRIVFLYSELAGYFLACAEELGKLTNVASVDIVHWPINPEAPFTFESTAEYSLHPKANYTREGLKKLLESINPTALVCSGWMDADYNAMAKQWRSKTPVVLTMDNWWTGSFKQWLAVLSSPFFIRRRFNRAWVPGEPQRPFAEKLGFRGKALATGFYCADPRPFQKVFETRKNRKPSKKLLYVGRYLDFKGVRELWAAFAALSDEFPEWELHCIGTGDLWEERMVHPKIFHHGFKQPDELPPFLEEAAGFVMPSKKEPWGVVLHEMAIAGVPLLASKEVGATHSYLKPGFNGMIIDSKSLKASVSRFISSSPEKLATMGGESNRLGLNYTPTNWTKTLIRLITMEEN